MDTIENYFFSGKMHLFQEVALNVGFILGIQNSPNKLHLIMQNSHSIIYSIFLIIH